MILWPFQLEGSVVSATNRAVCNYHVVLIMITNGIVSIISPLRLLLILCSISRNVDMQISSFMNVLEKWTFVFMKVPIQRVCSTDHNSFDSDDNETQECLYKQNRPHVVNVVDSAVFWRETHVAFGEKGIHLGAHDNHTSNTDSLCQKLEITILQGISIGSIVTGSVDERK